MDQSDQVFQTNNPSRWQRLKWGSRFILFVTFLIVTVLVISILSVKNSDSIVPLESRAIKKVLNENVPTYRESSIGKQYRGIKKFIDKQWAKGDGCGQKDSVLNLSTRKIFSDSLGIRAAFYVAWDLQSFVSLKKNINKVNLVLPEWFFIDPKGDTLFTNIDKKAFDIIKAAKVKVMPMLSNNFNASFNGEALHRILNNPQKKQRLINDVEKLLVKFKFAGINVDFEGLLEERNEVLTNFQKDLYTQLHNKGFLVTQNVSPFNEDYNYAELEKYNDYIFLMAYDEHAEHTKPGPISSQKWIEAAVDKLAKLVPPKKIVLNIAGYGYDWQKDGKMETLTYQQALVTARESSAKVDFDNNTYNLFYKYLDGNDKPHEVHFVDAATSFNTLRFSTEYGLAGTALWRLGAEDSRLWDFYDLEMTKEALKKFNFKEFETIPGSTTVDNIGDGEILDILSTPKDGLINTEIDTLSMLISEENYAVLPSSYVVRRFGKTSAKKLVLTYDDGPDPLYTKQILDTLAFYKVPACFFVVGLEAENNIPLVQRIVRDGHEIGNHTFTHPDMSKVSKQRALLEMDATKLLIECLTGRSTIMFRAPFNADSEPEKSEELVPIALSRSRNYITIGESLDPEDWQANEIKDFNADTIFNRVLVAYNRQIANGDSGNIILLHDAGGDRSQTVLATGMLIRHFRALGYTFTTVADLLGKKPIDMMPYVDKKDYLKLRVNYVWAEIVYLTSHFFFAFFLLFIFLSIVRLLILFVMAIFQRQKEKKAIFPIITQYPLVSIIVPAYNEEVNVTTSLNNLLVCNYPNFNIFFIDDGSKDATWQIVRDVFGGNKKIKLLSKPNGGKASALNYGLQQTDAAFVVCIDADTKLAPDAVAMLMQQFLAEKETDIQQIGAIAGIVKVGNENKILAKWQSIEYITSQNFDRKGFAYPNAITVVPGAIGAFRKEALEKAGGFTTDTLAEDCDVTIRILKAGYIVANEQRAIAYTEVPETIQQFMKQRFRWSFGVMQTFWKHRDALFNTKYKTLGFIALPDILVFKYIIPFFSPIADILMIIGLFTDSAERIGYYYLLFTALDLTIAAACFFFEKESLSKLIWLIPQRIIYRWLMLVVLFKSLRRALKGELQHWGVLKRTGNVKDLSGLMEAK